MRRLILLTAVLGISLSTRGQDPHCKNVEQMKLWYNPALKTDKNSYAHVTFHNVNYPEIISYSSKAITLELAFERTSKDGYENRGFITLTAGLHVDKASDGYMNASSAMMGFSYALPLDYNDTYIALGFQGNYSFNRVGNVGYSFTLPDQFDQYGALGWSLQRNPSKDGYNFGYFTAGAGAAIFHNKENTQWYIGTSMRYINHPNTNWDHINPLPTTMGVQGGYTTAVNDDTKVSVYTNVSWQNGSASSLSEQYIGLRGIRRFDINDSTAFHLSVGAGVSLKEALFPNIGLQLGRHLLEAYYELNLHRGTDDFIRRAYRVFYRYEL